MFCVLFSQTKLQAQPDLTVTAFTINTVSNEIRHYPSSNPTREYTLNFNATVKNIGNLQSGACKYALFSIDNTNAVRVGGESFPLASLNSGATKNITGTVKIITPLSQLDLKLRLHVDIGDTQVDFYSINNNGIILTGSISESNENNNSSQLRELPTNRDIMASGRAIYAGSNELAIYSPNGKYKLIYQTDGNLVLYKVAGNVALWSSRTNGQPAGRCEMQADGNLVIYKTNGQAIWSSGTDGGPFVGSYLRVQDDANVVIYKPDGTPAWATQTYMEQKTVDVLNSGQQMQTQPWRKIYSNNRKFYLELTNSGNLELRLDRDKRLLWQSNTTAANARCVMQPDGNFVLYRNNSSNPSDAVWSSGTSGSCYANSRIVLQDDGNLVIYRPNNQAVWSTGTDGAKVNTNNRPPALPCN